ncbi:hypothetical protein HKX48_004628 [Thoreauomyces humboldtii]|nr:hypothetical protein HKX48_004628 [Thoreauomyces humboldtii]
MSEQENGEANISDLAKSSGRKEAKSWLPAVPITILAPILVALALTATLLPNTFVINQASQDSTTYISQKYLNVLMAKTKSDAQAPLNKIIPLVNYLGEVPGIVEMFSATQPLHGLIDNPVISNLANLKHNYALDVVLCANAAWKPTYSPTNNPGYNADFANTMGVYNVTTLDYAYFSWVNVVSSPKNLSLDSFSIIDSGAPYNQTGWDINAQTFLPDKTSRPGNPLIFTVSNIMPPPGLMQLGLVPPATGAYFSVQENAGLVIGYVSQQFWAAGTTAETAFPLFTCLGGFQVTTTWIEMLQAAKPLNGSVVAMFNSTSIGVLGSSEMVVNNTAYRQADGSVLYGQPAVDPLTAAFQVEMSKKYLLAFECNPFSPQIAQATKILEANPTYELSVSGTTWIVNVDIVLLGTNDYALLMLAVPRTTVYGEIDRARAKAQALSIGISCAMAFIVAGVFVLVVLPLSALVRQMTQLTKFDFGSLESSGALDKRSWVWELRQVQIVFAMMVKAFAGAIKKNKDIVGSRQTPSSSNAGGGDKPRQLGASSRALPLTADH